MKSKFKKSGRDRYYNNRHNQQNNLNSRITNSLERSDNFSNQNPRSLLSLDLSPIIPMFPNNGFRTFPNNPMFENMQAPNFGTIPLPPNMLRFDENLYTNHYRNNFDVEGHFRNRMSILNFNSNAISNNNQAANFHTPPQNSAPNARLPQNKYNKTPNNGGPQSGAKLSAAQKVANVSEVVHSSSDSSVVHPNKINEVFNDVLGEQSPEVSSGRSANKQQTSQYNNNNAKNNYSSKNNINTNSDTGIYNRNSNYKYNWRKDDRPNNHHRNHEASEGKSSSSHDWHQKPKDKPKKMPHYDVAVKVNDEKNNKGSKSLPKKQLPEPDKTSQVSSKLNPQVKLSNNLNKKVTESLDQHKASDIPLGSNIGPTANDKSISSKRSKSKSNSNDTCTVEPATVEAPKEASSKVKNKKDEGKKPSRKNCPSASDEEADNDCIITDSVNHRKSPGNVNAAAAASSISNKDKVIDVCNSPSSLSKSISLINSATSSATKRPIALSTVSLSSPILSSKSSKKKKLSSKQTEDSTTKVPGKKRAAVSCESKTATTSSSTTATAPAISTAVTTAATGTATTTSSGNVPSIVKKPLTKTELLKLICPRSRKDQQRVERFMKEYSEKASKNASHSLTSVRATAWSTVLDSPSVLEHLDLASLDFKALKSDIPEELSDVINRVFDFTSTEKNPIVLDDDAEKEKEALNQSERTSGTPRPESASKATRSSRKRRASEAQSGGKKSKRRDTGGEVEGGKLTDESPSDNTTIGVITTNIPTNENVTNNVGSANENCTDISGPSRTNSASPAVNPLNNIGSPPPDGILQSLLHISLKEDELQIHIGQLDLEIQHIQACIVDLSHKLACKKHAKDMMVNEEKRLKAIRIQALRDSVNPNAISPSITQQQIQQQIMNMSGENDPLPSSEHFLIGGNNSVEFYEDNSIILCDQEVINIVPLADGGDEEDERKEIGLEQISIINSNALSSHDCKDLGEVIDMSIPQHVPKPYLSLSSRPLDNPHSQVRYLGTLCDLSNLFKKPTGGPDLSRLGQGESGFQVFHNPHNRPLPSDSNPAGQKEPSTKEINRSIGRELLDCDGLVSAIQGTG